MEASLKQIGQNLILVVDGVTHTKKFSEKEDCENVKSLFEGFKNEKNRRKQESAIKNILKMFTAVTEKAKETEKVKKKIVKKVEKETKQNTISKLEEENKKLRQQLSDLESKSNVKQTPSSIGTRRSGEY